jgi:hypothetical protein
MNVSRRIARLETAAAQHCRGRLVLRFLGGSDRIAQATEEELKDIRNRILTIRFVGGKHEGSLDGNEGD